MSSARFFFTVVCLLSLTTPCFAQTISAGDTAWVLASAALVFLMTPGLAFFYGGLVESTTVLNTLMMSFVSAAIVTVQFLLFGYSFAFSSGHSGFGGDDFYALSNVHLEPNPAYSATIPHLAFFMFQLTFAIITPALISGAVIGRLRFRSWLVFVLLWSTIVYDMIAHWVWATWTDSTGATKMGWLKEKGVLDFAGGTVVHITSGFSALVACIIIGKRTSLPSEETVQAHNVPFVLLGTAMLWFGWFGFNGGSALNATDGVAALACVNTAIGSAVAFLVWSFLEYLHSGKFSAVGAATGIVVGLVTITPACGYVSPAASLAIGAIGTGVSFYGMRLKNLFGFDDALDVFACHGLGGVAGSILTGCFANKRFNSAGDDGAFYGNGKLLGWQIVACLVVAAVSSVLTAGILLIIKYIPFLGLRPTPEEEAAGLDLLDHGHIAYGGLSTKPDAKPNSSPRNDPLQVNIEKGSPEERQHIQMQAI